ncbi:MAG: NAD(P)-dependent oxidoreductase [Desulfobacteraceae bacterium]|nr:NAD(P)-dependent oxidoreductase [Desulfobacteraceae bacterium]
MNISLLGTGLMGLPMAERILGADHELVVFNRTLEKAEPLKALGARIASSAKDALRSSECIILMLADAQAIHHVVLRNEARTELSGRTVIQMGTISPSESMDLNEQVIESGGEYLEAPVLGSIPEAVSGGLIVLVGSSPEQFEHWSGLLRCFGPEPLLIGPVGQASALKLALNQLIASLTAAFSLSLGFVQRKGIKVDLFMKILRESALYAPTFDKKLQRMLERDYSNPNFPTRHLAKDIDLFLSEAKGMNLQSAGLEGLDRLVKMTLDDGMNDMDYSALFNTINP